MKPTTIMNTTIGCCRKREQLFRMEGLLMAADHGISIRRNNKGIKMFIIPDLAYYNRERTISTIEMMMLMIKNLHHSNRPTGAGKTDFLLRRCKGRVFYTLPTKHSINAMYDRIKNDLDTVRGKFICCMLPPALKMEGCRKKKINATKHRCFLKNFDTLTKAAIVLE